MTQKSILILYIVFKIGTQKQKIQDSEIIEIASFANVCKSYNSMIILGVLREKVVRRL